MKYFCLLSLLLTSTLTAATCVPLNSSVNLFDEGDAEDCEAQIDAAVALGNRRLNILFTAHYLLGAGEKVRGYCFRTNRNVCEPVTPEILERIHGHWNRCLEVAASKVDYLSVYLQIDDAGATNLWRNNLKFDPLAKHAGYSYDDIMTAPLAAMVKATAKPETFIEFSLQGEMGATLASNPDSYTQLAALTKERLKPLTKVEVGVNVNYSAVLGFGTKLTAAQVPAVQRMMDAMDFFGVSAYHEVNVPIQPTDFRLSYETAHDEMSGYGVELGAKRTRISEMGMGGGNRSDDGKSPAKTIAEMAECLWSGVRGPYKAALDPFAKPAFRDFRRDFYRELLKFLASPPEDFALHSAYLWNSDSWDVQGLYASTRGYEDATIIDAIRRHNDACR